MKAQDPRRVGIYVRISEDRDDTAAGVGRQEQDCKALAARLGWTITAVYAENDTSAFKRRRVTLPDGTKAMRNVRPEFRRMLSDLSEGTIEGLIAYNLDRLLRQPRDLEDLIDVCEETKHPATSATGALDLSSDAGITQARVQAALANQSSRDTGRRVARAREDAAANGRWSGGGRRAYGYTADRSAVVPDEATVLASIAADVLAGLSLNAIMNRLNAAKVPTVSGGPWSARAVRSAVTKPAVAGKLVYRGEIMSTPAPWPAVLDEDVWDRVCVELSDRTPRQTNQLTHWLSGVLVCGIPDCGLTLRGNGDRYWCGSTTSRGMRGCGKISIVAKPTEHAVEQLLFARIRNTKVQAVPARSIAPDDTQLVELAKMWGAKELTLAEYRAARATILEGLQAPPPPRVPAWVGPNIADEWDDKTPAAKRRVALAFLEGVVVRPTVGRRAWSPDRLEPHWR